MSIRSRLVLVFKYFPIMIIFFFSFKSKQVLKTCILMHLHNLVNLSKLSFPKSVGGKQEKENISFPRNVLFKNYEIELVSVF